MYQVHNLHIAQLHHAIELEANFEERIKQSVSENFYLQKCSLSTASPYKTKKDRSVERGICKDQCSKQRLASPPDMWSRELVYSILPDGLFVGKLFNFAVPVVRLRKSSELSEPYV